MRGGKGEAPCEVARPMNECMAMPARRTHHALADDAGVLVLCCLVPSEALASWQRELKAQLLTWGSQ